MKTNESISQNLPNLLRECYTDIKLRRPEYSLRSFAQKLSISPSAASEIMSGKRKVSAKMASLIMEKLHINPEKQKAVLASMSASFENKKMISNEEFKIISDWYYFAILSLMETVDYKNDVPWIAKRLGVSEKTVNDAFKNLEAVGLVQLKNNQYKWTGEYFKTPDNVPSYVVRKSHAENIHLGLNSLENDAIEIRDFLGMTMAISTEKIPEAKKMLREFLSKFEKAMSTDKPDEVYRLNLQLIPMTRKIRGDK